MKTLIKALLWLLLIIIIFIIGALLYVKLALPNVGPAPKLKVNSSAEHVAKGEYLANHVCVCIDCHSKRDQTLFSAPPIAGTIGMGGELFDQKYGFPGAYYAKNITPEGISRYTDGELLRAITTGVDKDGKALFPVMMYHYYGQMDQEDIKDIIAYIRTLKPIKNEVPLSVSDFPMNFIINMIPEKAHFTKCPANSDTLAYGRYLTNAAGCMECHTQVDKGRLIAGTEFGGGRAFPFPDGSVANSANITPDKETGIGGWSEEQFLKMFRVRNDSAALATHLKPSETNTIMPWVMYGGMSDEDLSAIFKFLQSVKPITNHIVKFTKAKN